MSQSIQTEVQEQIFHDLKSSCFAVAHSCLQVLQDQKVSDNALNVLAKAMFDLLWAESMMSLRYGLNCFKPEYLKVEESDSHIYPKIDNAINSLDKLESKYKSHVVEYRLEQLKSNFISMQEYDGTWEALYSTEERPF